MIADSHMHSNFSSDSETPMDQMVQQAIHLGIESICFTDHYDKDYENDSFQLETEPYLKSIALMCEKYGDQIEIRSGVELGLQIHLKEWIQSYVNKYSFDFIIGSMHLLEGRDPYYPENFSGRSDEDLLRQYFRDTAANIESFHTFQSLGHLDYLARYLNWKAGDYRYRDYQDEIDEVLKKLIQYGIALEINTGGCRSRLARTNPGKETILRYRELGGELITIGADGHTPEQVGYGFSHIAELLEECGYRYYTVYRQKKPIFISIKD